MGLFNRKQPNIIHDYTFGELRPRTAGAGHSFEGIGQFEMGTGKTVKVPFVIYTNDTTPTPAQQDFFQNLKNNFQQYTNSMVPLLEKELKLWGKDITIQDFNKEFSVATLVIQAAEEPPVCWEAILNTIHDTNHQIIIDFSGDEPVDILIDV
jgi:hypothetical protein